MSHFKTQKDSEEDTWPYKKREVLPNPYPRFLLFWVTPAGVLRFLASAVGMTGTARTGTASSVQASVTAAQDRSKVSLSMFSEQLRRARKVRSLDNSSISLLQQKC